MKLTLARIEGLTCPAGKKDALIFDSETPGLAVRVNAGGGKNFVGQYTYAGRKCRLPLGRCSEISLAKARAEMKGIALDLRAGVDLLRTWCCRLVS